jgi:nucleotide-binding universal stress UspA family protein
LTKIILLRNMRGYIAFDRFYTIHYQSMRMKKFIVAIDGLKYSRDAIDYAVHLSKQANAHLVGVFLDDFTYHSYKIYELVGDEVEDLMRRRIALEEKDERTRQQSVDHFEETCHKAGLEYTIHHDRNTALQELLHESIYADLLIIDGKETLTHYSENLPTRFIRDLLSQVQCPVLVVPGKYVAPGKIVMLYDGSPTAVYAVRMFSYVLSALKHLEAEVLFVKKESGGNHLPDNRLMKEFMKRHFPKATYTVLKGDTEALILKHLATSEENVLVVSGAYERGMVSRWFKPSIADALMKNLQFPLFIAHSK